MISDLEHLWWTIIAYSTSNLRLAIPTIKRAINTCKINGARIPTKMTNESRDAKQGQEKLVNLTNTPFCHVAYHPDCYPILSRLEFGKHKHKTQTRWVYKLRSAPADYLGMLEKKERDRGTWVSRNSVFRRMINNDASQLKSNFFSRPLFLSPPRPPSSPSGLLTPPTVHVPSSGESMPHKPAAYAAHQRSLC